MALRVKKRFKIMPGVYINMGKTGASLSVGVKGATVNIGKKGTRTTVGIPGTGLSHSTYTKHNTSSPPSSAPKVNSSVQNVNDGSVLYTIGAAFLGACIGGLLWGVEGVLLGMVICGVAMIVARKNDGREGSL